MEQEQARLDALIRSRTAAEAEQQARLDALARARTAAEAQLAALQRDIAAAQREAAALSRREAAAAAAPVAGPAPDDPPPAPARPAREAPATGGQPRVFVHHRTGSAAGAEAAAALVGPLREGGFDVPEMRPVPAVPSQRVVRYFHARGCRGRGAAGRAARPRLGDPGFPRLRALPRARHPGGLGAGPLRRAAVCSRTERKPPQPSRSQQIHASGHARRSRATR